MASISKRGEYLSNAVANSMVPNTPHIVAAQPVMVPLPESKKQDKHMT
ncbi:hypothetical protein ASZ90_018221 [hydrocarbon metagenome]|uniref:Uncharacterized protein n=1 Tax=hydrocarbon metagenome TaxID=938273 RepID=A0A0W8E716_9ZZZZ